MSAADNNNDVPFAALPELTMSQVEACYEERDADLCICSDPADGHEPRCPRA